MMGTGTGQLWRSGTAAAVLLLMLSACIPASGGGGGKRPPALPADRAVSMTDAPPPSLPAVPEPGAATPVIANAPSVAEQSYVVRAGDTLRGIGNRTGAGSEAIARANGLAPPFVIRPGQRLRIPGGRYHLVEDGQTGLAIAEAYGVSWRDIIAANGLAEPVVLRRGQRLRLPDAPAHRLSIEERAAAFRLDMDDVVSGSSVAEREVEAAPTLPAARPAPDPALPLPPQFRWPVDGRLIARFGPAANGVRNQGIDIAVPAGTPVRAAAAGTVRFSSENASVFGGLVLIDHGGGWMSAYGYLGRVDGQQGARVAQGQVIGLSGDSGYGSVAKLHFEIRKDRRPLDPLSRLPRR